MSNQDQNPYGEFADLVPKKKAHAPVRRAVEKPAANPYGEFADLVPKRLASQSVAPVSPDASGMQDSVSVAPVKPKSKPPKDDWLARAAKLPGVRGNAMAEAKGPTGGPALNFNIEPEDYRQNEPVRKALPYKGPTQSATGAMVRGLPQEFRDMAEGASSVGEAAQVAHQKVTSLILGKSKAAQIARGVVGTALNVADPLSAMGFFGDLAGHPVQAAKGIRDMIRRAAPGWVPGSLPSKDLEEYTSSLLGTGLLVYGARHGTAKVRELVKELRKSDVAPLINDKAVAEAMRKAGAEPTAQPAEPPSQSVSIRPNPVPIPPESESETVTQPSQSPSQSPVAEPAQKTEGPLSHLSQEDLNKVHEKAQESGDVHTQNAAIAEHNARQAKKPAKVPDHVLAAAARIKARLESEAADAAAKRLTGKISANPFLDPESLKDMLTLGGYVLEGAARDFGKWSSQMVEHVGEAIRPHLQELWDRMHQPQPTGSATKNESTNQTRAEMGIPEHETPEAQTFQQWVDEAKEQGLADSEHTNRVTQEVLEGRKDHLTPQESAGLAARADALSNEYKALTEEGHNASPERQVEISRRLGDIHDEFRRLSDATKRAGTEQARAFVARKMQVAEDYRLLPVLDRAEAAKARPGEGRIPLTDAERKELTNRVNELERKQREHEEALKAEQEGHGKTKEELEAAKGRVSYLEKYMKGRKGMPPKEGEAPKPVVTRKARTDSIREGIKKERESALNDLREAWRKAGGNPKGNQSGAASLPPLDPEVLRHIGRVAKTFIDEGVLNVDDLHAKVNEALKDVGIAVSKTDLAKGFDSMMAARGKGRVITDRGRFQQILRLQGQIAKAIDGELDESGKTPRATDKELADLYKQLAEAKKNNKDPVIDRYTRRLDDAMKRLADARAGRFRTKPKTTVPKGAEDLAKKIDAANKEIAQLRARAKAARSPAAKTAYEQAVARAEKVLSDLKAGKKRVKPTPLQGPELDKLREQAKQLRGDKSAQEKVDELTRQLAMSAADFLKHRQQMAEESRQKAERAKGQRVREDEIEGLKEQIRRRIEDLRPKTFAEQAAQVLRADVLTSPPVIEKLLGASAWHYVTGSMNDLMAHWASRLPGGGGRSLGQIAPEEATGGTWQRLSGPFRREAWKNALDEWRKGFDEIDRQSGASEYGKGGTMLQKLMSAPGRLHASEKTIGIKTGERNAAMKRILKTATPEELADPEWRKMAQMRAGAAAQDAILRGTSPLAESINQSINQALKSPSASVRVYGLVRAMLAPIVKMPLNFFKATTDYAGGGIPRGAALLLKELRASEGKAIPREAAAEIQRAFKRGGTAAVAMYLGFAQPKWFKSGGYYVKGVKQDDPNEPGFGEFVIAGHKVPKLLAHSPFAEAIQFWASIRHGLDRGDKNAYGRGAAGLAETLPGLYGGKEVLQNLEQGKVGAATGKLASEYNPILIQRLARATDMEKGDSGPKYFVGGEGKPVPRQADTFLSSIGEGVPGWRRTLPRKDIPEPQKGQTYKEYMRVMPLASLVVYRRLLRSGESVPFAKDIPGKNLDQKLRSLQGEIKAKKARKVQAAARKAFDAKGRQLSFDERMKQIEDARKAGDALAGKE